MARLICKCQQSKPTRVWPLSKCDGAKFDHVTGQSLPIYQGRVSLVTFRLTTTNVPHYLLHSLAGDFDHGSQLPHASKSHSMYLLVSKLGSILTISAGTQPFAMPPASSLPHPPGTLQGADLFVLIMLNQLDNKHPSVLRSNNLSSPAVARRSFRAQDSNEWPWGDQKLRCDGGYSTCLRSIRSETAAGKRSTGRLTARP